MVAPPGIIWKVHQVMGWHGFWLYPKKVASQRGFVKPEVLVPLLLGCFSCQVELTCRKAWHEAWNENQMTKSCPWSWSHINFQILSHHSKWSQNCQITKIKGCHPLTPKSSLSRRPLCTALGTPPWDKALPPAQPWKALSSAFKTAKQLFSMDNALIHRVKAGRCSLLSWLYTIAMLEKKSP